jgi:hypothetical protein
MTAPDAEARPQSASTAIAMLRGAFQPTAVVPHPLPAPAAGADQETLSRADAQALLRSLLVGWDANSLEPALTLTRFALVDWSLSEQGAVDAQTAAFMLHGALNHDYRADYWAKQVPDVSARLKIYQTLLASPDNRVVASVLAQMLTEPAGTFRNAALDTAIIERLIGLAAHGANTAARSDAFSLLKRIIQPAKEWAKIRYNPAADLELAELALSDSPYAVEAARLIGRIRSESALSQLLAPKPHLREETVF